MKPQVFISYKSEEYFYADKVRFALEQSGVPCWMAPESIRGGSSYAAEIPKAIRDCQVFVLILTEKSQESQWVKREIDRAINEHKLIIPFMPEEMTFNDDITFYLTNVQQYFAFRDWDRELNRMIDNICDEIGIERVIPAPPQPEPLPEPQPVEQPVMAQVSAQPAAAGIGTTPPAAEKKKKTKTPKAPKEKAPAGKKKKGLLIGLIAAAVIVAVVVIILVVNNMNSLTICGERVDRSQNELALEKVTITADDIEAMSQMENIQTLTVSNCTFDGVTDLSTINCDNMRYLTISRSRISTYLLETLKIENASLSSLDLSDNNLDSLSILTKLKDPDSLNTFDFSGNKIKSLEALKNMRNLKSLNVDGNDLATLSGLEGCIYLESVSARDNGLVRIDGLSNTTLLTTVNLSGNYLSDVDALSGSAGQITRLYLSGNHLSDISFVEKMYKLEYLNISDNNITDISPISATSNLVGLDASNNKITTADMSKARAIPLQYLDLSGNELTGLSETTYNWPLEWLNLAGNPLNDGLSLKITADNTLAYVNLHGCTVGSAYADTFHNKFKTLILDYDEGLDLSSMTILDKVFMIDCPLDKQVAVDKALDGKVEFLTSKEYENRDDLGPENFAEYTYSKDLIQKVKGSEQ